MISAASTPTPLVTEHTATTDIYTLSLHDALPISSSIRSGRIRIAPACARSSGGARTSGRTDRKSTRLNSSHVRISYAGFCLKKKKQPSKQSRLGNEVVVFCLDAVVPQGSRGRNHD